MIWIAGIFLETEIGSAGKEWDSFYNCYFPQNMGDRQYHLKFDADKGRAVDEYLEYRR